MRPSAIFDYSVQRSADPPTFPNQYTTRAFYDESLAFGVRIYLFELVLCRNCDSLDMQKTKKTKKVAQAEEKPIAEEKEKVETEDEEDEDQEEEASADEEVDDSTEGADEGTKDKSEATAEDGPPAKKLKKAEKKLGWHYNKYHICLIKNNNSLCIFYSQ